MAGYYSWVCFIDVQRGGWFGPISYSEIDDYRDGFALDDNIKSFTEFQYFEERPRDPLTCNFSKMIRNSASRKGKTATFADCTRSDTAKPSEKAQKEGCGCCGDSAWEAREIETPAALKLTNVASRTFTWGTISTGKCEIRDGYRVTIFENGRWIQEGTFKCNAGGIISCEVWGNLKLYSDRNADGKCAGDLLVNTRVFNKSAGPGNTRDLDSEGNDSSIAAYYQRIRCARLSTECEWGP